MPRRPSLNNMICAEAKQATAVLALCSPQIRMLILNVAASTVQFQLSVGDHWFQFIWAQHETSCSFAHPAVTEKHYHSFGVMFLVT